MLKYGQTAIDLSKLSTNVLTISEQLIALSQDYKQRCLVILDPYLNPINAPFMEYYNLHHRLHQVLIMHPSILANKRPLLIELDLRDKYEQAVLNYIVDQALKQLRPESITAGNGQQYCAWLFTHDDTQQILNTIAALVLQTRNQKKILLRYYDPAVFFQLMSLLNTQQQSKLLSHIDIWTMLSRDGTLKIHRNDEKSKPLLTGQLGISDEQYQKIDCIGINNQIIHSQRLKQPTLFIDEIQSLQTIMPCLLRLMKKNIDDQDLQLEWAKLALRWEGDFDLVPKIQTRIDQCLNLRQYYQLLDELQQLSAKEWQTLPQVPNEE